MTFIVASAKNNYEPSIGSTVMQMRVVLDLFLCIPHIYSPLLPRHSDACRRGSRKVYRASALISISRSIKDWFTESVKSVLKPNV